MSKAQHFYGSSWIDRLALHRLDSAWVESARTSPEARFVPVSGVKSLLSSDESPSLVLLEASACGVAPDPDPDVGVASVLLGRDDQHVYFALDWSDQDATPSDSGLDHASFVDLRRAGLLMEAREAGLAAYARAMVHWHQTHRYCGACGASTDVEQAGYLRRCRAEGCGRQHFPRTDPAIIVRVTHGERVLLGRQATWPKRWFSVLAGFVEPGESLEDCVRREVLEETGVAVHDIVYNSSQPWPFPSSLMLGFSAVAAGDELKIQDDELEEARWFERNEILAGVADGELRLSPITSISRHLIDEWLGPVGAAAVRSRS